MAKIDGQSGEQSLTRLGDARRALRSAEREFQCSPPFGNAARAIVEAWDAVTRSADADPHGPVDSSLGPREREIWRESLSRVQTVASRRDGGESSAGADAAVRLDLRDQLDWLSRVIALRERRRKTDSRGLGRIHNPSLPAVVAVVAALALVLAAVVAEPVSRRPWRGSYISERADLAAGRGSVEPVIRHQRRLDFDWGRRSPVPGLGGDGFSVRWDACLIVPEGSAPAVALAFHLQSDDDARMWLDERPLLHGARRRGPSQASASVSLAPGPHHLRVEYRDTKGPAFVSLVIQDGSVEPESRARWLSAPPEPFEASDPCRLAARERSQ